MLNFIRLLAFAFLFALTGSSLSAAEEPSLEEQIVNALNKVFGTYPSARANHAKGIVAEGHFKAWPQISKLCKAAIFNGSIVPVTVRFSDSTGLPEIPDGSAQANPHGLAIKYHLPDGTETDMVTNSLKFFPVSNGADFRDLFLALAASPPDAPKPTKFEQFAAAHPSVPAAFATSKTPASFATDEYNGVNAFIFVNETGQKQAVRYLVTPEKLEHLDPAAAAKQPANFLLDELPKRLARGPVVFHLKVRLAAPSDPINDATKAWPEDRPIVELGVLTIDKTVPDSSEAEKPLLFLPGQLLDGIEASTDPLIDVRDSTYAISFSRRNP